jgi:hypothetical protein
MEENWDDHSRKKLERGDFLILTSHASLTVHGTSSDRCAKRDVRGYDSVPHI